MNNDAFEENYSKSDLYKGLLIYIILEICGFLPKSVLLKITNNQLIIDNIQFIVYFILFLITIVFFLNKYKVHKSMFSENNLKYSQICFVCIIALMVISAIFLDKMHIEDSNELGLEQAAKTGYYFLFVLTAVVLGPFVEETIYRFCFFRYLNQYNEVLAHIIVALLFGFMHCGNAFFKTLDFRQLCNIMPYFLMSIGLSVAYKKTGNIIFPMIIHSAINLIATLN